MGWLSLLEFIDIGFMRYIFILCVDGLISGGYLMPEQREAWVNGWAHIVGLVGFVIFTAIWQHNSHKKTVTTVIDKTEVPPTTVVTTETMNVETKPESNVLEYLTK